jgi:uncharacterized protein YceK
MKINAILPMPFASVVLVITVLVLSGCNSVSTRTVASGPTCIPPEGHSLERAIVAAKQDLAHGCATHFDRYMDTLLSIAEGDPKPENRQDFSELLVWASDQGLISSRQAKEMYNRYFNVKFVSMMGEYNNCSYTCPRKDQVLYGMEQELLNKEQGLLKITGDASGYHQADRLFKETELVLEATCSACAATR